ncbi:MAG TPA: hypothetical protein VKO63_12915 [Chitinispirillaceae bacterium]|nr:hypothetical protein [Chitinispirillaceae bacterium]
MAYYFKQILLIIAACGCAIIFNGCGFAPNDDRVSTGGTGSEVVGVVNYPDSSTAMKKLFGTKQVFPVMNAGVFIHPKQYYAENESVADIPVVYTAADGSFRIQNVLPGEHIVYIRDNAGKAVAHKIIVPDNGTRVSCGTIYAAPVASAQIQYQGIMPGNVLFYVSVRGTGITIKCTERNIYAVMNSIPMGLTDGYTITIRVLQPFKNGKDITIPSLKIGDITTLQPFADF